MRIDRLDPADLEKVRACHEVYRAARRAEEPDGPCYGERLFGAWLTNGWRGDPREVWTAAEGGSVAGWYLLEMPDKENLDQANLEVVVHPAARRQGLGLGLLRHAAGRAAARGRSVLTGAARDGSAGEGFCRSVGSTAGLVDVQRVLEPAKLDEGRRAELRSEAERAASGYSLVSWTGLVPEEFIEHVADLNTALSDAPSDAQWEREVWDAQRVRESVNGLRPRFGTRNYSVAARHDATGELAGLTELAVDPPDPSWGYQLITAVTRAHRGHRLGLLVKVAMLDWLATAEPQLEQIVTWNARDNKHMIAVNEALGYTILGPPGTWYRLDVAALQG